MYGTKFLERNRHAPKTTLVGAKNVLGKEMAQGDATVRGHLSLILVKLYHVLIFPLEHSA